MTITALEDLNTATERLNEARNSCKQSCTVFGNLGTTKLERSLPHFQKNLPILLPGFGRSLPTCGEAALQMHIRKAFRISASILKTSTVYYTHLCLLLQPCVVTVPHSQCAADDGRGKYTSLSMHLPHLEAVSRMPGVGRCG